MVNIVNQFKIEEEWAEKKSLIHKLAKEVFGNKRVSCLNRYDYGYIVIYGNNGVGGQAHIDVSNNSIKVDREEDYQNCLRLAEICEKTLNQEFTLQIGYEK
jgi:hypothetical protein